MKEYKSPNCLACTNCTNFLRLEMVEVDVPATARKPFLGRRLRTMSDRINWKLLFIFMTKIRFIFQRFTEQTNNIEGKKTVSQVFSFPNINHMIAKIMNEAAVPEIMANASKQEKETTYLLSHQDHFLEDFLPTAPSDASLVLKWAA